MMLRSFGRAAIVVAGVVLTWGGSRLAGAAFAAAPPAPLAVSEPPPILITTPNSPSLGVQFGQHSFASLPANDVLGGPAATVASNAAENVAAIPLPPSAYPGMVGLATAALSVWRYRRRRR